jgi:hypothetical protein
MPDLVQEIMDRNDRLESLLERVDVDDYEGLAKDIADLGPVLMQDILMIAVIRLGRVQDA